jgi:hypothetical protein
MLSITPEELPLALQTSFAELVDLCEAASAARDFPEQGGFTAKTVKGRRYWYFQSREANGARRQRYVGPETPKLLASIAKHGQERGGEQARRKIVVALLAAGLPRPHPSAGAAIEALSRAGVFRLRATLVGTAAFQCYCGLLGALFSSRMLQTGDIDIAQFRDVSVAVEDATAPALEVLRAVDASFQPVPYAFDQSKAASYLSAGGLRVEFLTPNRGPERDAPVALPALGTDAQPLRFLDFLIRNPIQTVLLHGSGVLVSVPAPERFAWHKLIVARRRRQGAAKVEKDLAQAQALIAILAEKRPYDLRDAWDELAARGPQWRKLAREGWMMLAAETRARAAAKAELPAELAAA